MRVPPLTQNVKPFAPPPSASSSRSRRCLYVNLGRHYRVDNILSDPPSLRTEFYGQITGLTPPPVPESGLPRRTVITNSQGVVLYKNNPSKPRKVPEWIDGVLTHTFSHVEVMFSKAPNFVKNPTLCLTDPDGTPFTAVLQKAVHIISENVDKTESFADWSNNDIWLALKFADQIYNPLKYLLPFDLLPFPDDTAKREHLISRLKEYLDKQFPIIDFNILRTFFESCAPSHGFPVFNNTFQIGEDCVVRSISCQFLCSQMTDLWSHLVLDEQRIKDRMRLHLPQHLDDLPVSLVILDNNGNRIRVDIDKCYDEFIKAFETPNLGCTDMSMFRFQDSNVSLNFYKYCTLSGNPLVLKDLLVIYFTRRRITLDHLLATYFPTTIDGAKVIQEYENLFSTSRGKLAIVLTPEEQDLFKAEFCGITGMSEAEFDGFIGSYNLFKVNIKPRFEKVIIYANHYLDSGSMFGKDVDFFTTQLTPPCHYDKLKFLDPDKRGTVESLNIDGNPSDGVKKVKVTSFKIK